MKSICFVFMLLILIGSEECLAQEQYNFYIPAGFQNPLLRSGDFIAGLYYKYRKSDNSVEEQVTRNLSKNFTLSGFLGITDNLTVRGQLDLYPEHYVSEIIAGGSGGQKVKFYLQPQLVLSYRPVKSMEIFGDMLVSNLTIENGPRSMYQDVPVGIDNEGNYIYERRLVMQPGWGDTGIEGLTYRVGVTINGSLW